MITYAAARKWLALYFLLFTVIIGLYVLIFAESVLLPLSSSDAGDVFRIIVPVLLGQVTIVFQWIANSDRESRRICPIPRWAIVCPALLSSTVILVTALAMAIGNFNDIGFGVSPDAFKTSVTLAVAILNASTVFLVARLFPSDPASGS